MSSIGTIWTRPSNPRTIKVQAVAAINGHTVDTSPTFTMGITNKSREFLANFPLGQVPTFKSRNGLRLFDPDAIAQYAAESGTANTQLLGATAEEPAVIRQWICFADHEFNAPLTTLKLLRYGMAVFDATAEDSALRHLEEALGVLEKHLQGRTWVATGELSLAHVSVAAGLYWGFAKVMDRKMRDKYSRTIRYYK